MKLFKKLIFLFVCTFILFGTIQAKNSNHEPLDETERLAALGKVWGFLKYYHPVVATGANDWDVALINAIPAVRGAGDFDSFNTAIANLISEAGNFDKGDHNPDPEEISDASIFRWIKNRDVFSKENRKTLWMLKVKHVPAENHYVQPTPRSNQASFKNENPYFETRYPGEELRLLALYRFWNAIQYFFPYRDIMDEDWEDVLEEYIPVMLEVEDELAYHLAFRKFTACINDSHAFFYSAPLAKFFGGYIAPFRVKFREDKTVVTKVYTNGLGPDDDIRVGDVILKYMDTDITAYRNKLRPYVAGSNAAVIEREISYRVAYGPEGRRKYTVSRNGETMDVFVKTYYVQEFGAIVDQYEQQLPKWEILEGNIGLVRMNVLAAEDVPTAMAELMNTKGIIFDIRDNAFGTMYYLGYYLVPGRVPFVTFTEPNYDIPGEFKALPDPYSIGYNNPDTYQGTVALLVDEQTQSHSEFTTMALQNAPKAVIIGHNTSGADGNVTYIDLPGIMRAYFTGLGVFYPDGSPTQRIGIVPDIYSSETVEALSEGRDDVIETAIDYINKNEDN